MKTKASRFHVAVEQVQQRFVQEPVKDFSAQVNTAGEYILHLSGIYLLHSRRQELIQMGLGVGQIRVQLQGCG